MAMMHKPIKRTTSTKKDGGCIEQSNHHEVTVLQYAPDTDVRIMDNIYEQHSLENSLYGLSLEYHGMPASRERCSSFDSFASSSSTFSLAPRTSSAIESREFAPISEMNNLTKGIIVHPQTKGRPVVEFVFDDIPDQLMVPIL